MKVTNPRVRTMRLVSSILLLALAASPAMAQGKGRSQNEQKASPKEDLAKKKADEEAYQRALKNIPEPKGKIDPWQGSR